MADLNERVSRLEEQSDAHIRMMDYLRKDMSDLRHSMETLNTDLRGEMATLSSDLRGEMALLSDRVDRKFNWLIGIVITSTIANLGAIGGALWAVLQSVR